MIIKQIFCTFLFLLLFSAGSYADLPQHPQEINKEFHSARTPIEHSLDSILTQAAASETLFCAILPKRCTPTADDLAHIKFYSATLLSAIRKTEQMLLKSDCNGVYRDHEICGIDYDPILCGQENSNDGYLYKTIHTDAETAEVLSIWADPPINPNSATRYSLIKEKGLWKLDSVDCGKDGPRFNVQ